MARLFAWCDHPHAPTGFGRSANHVLYALHEAGHEIVQLAVNADTETQQPPWKVYTPDKVNNDPYGLSVLQKVLDSHRFDAMWTTFDPEIPWRYTIGDKSALSILTDLRAKNPGFKTLGWFPVDGGPLSDWELAAFGMADPKPFDVSVTMADHVHKLIAWSLKLRGMDPNLDAITKNVPVIPHGVDLSTYVIPTTEQKREAKRQMGIDPDTFVILQMERNQQRKQNYLALEVLERLFKKAPELYGKVLLYQHMVQDEENTGCMLGFNLPEMAIRYSGPGGKGLVPGKDVLWPGGFIAEEALRGIVFPAADAFLSVSTGEGFQYPAWEALACGIPLVVPNADARSAWFTGVPNTFLYGPKFEPWNGSGSNRELVMRGGYSRRMNLPSTESASLNLLKLIRGKQIKGRGVAPEAGRAFVEKVADHRVIAKKWVDLVEEQLRTLKFERQGAGFVDYMVTDAEDLDGVMLDCSQGFGLGDTILAAPALAAARKANPDLPLSWHVPGQNMFLAGMMDTGASLALEPMNALVKLPMHAHTESDEWRHPEAQRTEFIADMLEEAGYTGLKLERHEVPLPAEARRQFSAGFLQRFGVDPSECVAVAPEASTPQRTLPESAALQLCARIKAMGLTPVLVGRKQTAHELVGVLNLTGRLPLPDLRLLLGAAGAVVSVDAATLYLAAVQNTPVVGVFTCVAPDARMTWIGKGPKATVTPDPGVGLEGESFPAGPFPKAGGTAWGDQIRVSDLDRALHAVLGLEPAGPVITAPKEDL